MFLASFVLGMVTVWCPEKFDSVAIIQEQIFKLLSPQWFFAFTDKLVDSLDIFSWKGSLLSLFKKCSQNKRALQEHSVAIGEAYLE